MFFIPRTSEQNPEKEDFMDDTQVYRPQPQAGNFHWERYALLVKFLFTLLKTEPASGKLFQKPNHQIVRN